MTIDYVSSYFPHKVLPRIETRPTNNTMIKANPYSVILNLGGGTHGYLGLVIPESVYNKIIGTTYKKPLHPGELAIEENTPLHETIILRKLHNQ